jgi:hypothetical protein
LFLQQLVKQLTEGTGTGKKEAEKGKGKGKGKGRIGEGVGTWNGKRDWAGKGNERQYKGTKGGGVKSFDLFCEEDRQG